jgi:23S rRNA (uracil1939-C5)-methyltransferase
MLETLIAGLREIAESADRSRPLADLYCGVGTFARFLGGLFPRLELVEAKREFADEMSPWDPLSGILRSL